MEVGLTVPLTHLCLSRLQSQVAKEDLGLGGHNHFPRRLSHRVQGSSPDHFRKFSSPISVGVGVAGLPIAMQLCRGPGQIFLAKIRNLIKRKPK